VKRLLARPAAQRFVCWLAARYIRLVLATGRWTVAGDESARRHAAEAKPFIGCFWHGRMLMMPGFWKSDRPISMLISDHLDGRLIARVIAYFGIGTIIGSSSRGGADALRAMLKALKSGVCVCVTPDGPRGPSQRVRPGLLIAAKLAQVPVIPGSYSSTRARPLGSWDRFLFALPFGRGVYVLGEPVMVPPDADDAAIETARTALERQLNAITATADELCGRLPAAPAPAPPAAGAPP
jgi:hypothetical protein